MGATIKLTQMLKVTNSALMSSKVNCRKTVGQQLREQPLSGFDLSIVDQGLSLGERSMYLDHYRIVIDDYQKLRQERGPGVPKIAVITCITGTYDSLKVPAHLDPRLDYVLFTDRPRSGGGVWDVRPLDIVEACKQRAARYAKMTLHRLLPDHDIGVWIDANLRLIGDIFPMIEAFIAAPQAIGAVRHPHRSDIYEELEACILQKKDKAGIMREQIAAARRMGFVHDDLVESNLLMFKLRDPRASRFLAAWRAELERYSKRDQLGFNIAMRKAGTSWHPLIDRPVSARNHPAFIYLPHDGEQGPAQDLLAALAVPPTDPWSHSPDAATRLPRDIQVANARTSAEAAAALAASGAAITIIKDPAVRLGRAQINGLARSLLASPAAGIAVPSPFAKREFQGSNRHVPAGSRICLAVSRAVCRAGLFPDESLLSGSVGWDVDFCFRATDLGFETRLASRVIVPPLAQPPVPETERADALAKLAARHGRHRLKRMVNSWRLISRELVGLPEVLAVEQAIE